MREIKFRAWDMKKKQMLTIFDSSVGSDWYLPSWKENYKVMQYTGLKDKNGVEVYEGDILRATPNGTEHMGQVYYEDAQWFGACDYLGYAVAYSGAEVIGNIHEQEAK